METIEYYDEKIKEMSEHAKKFENAYIKCMGTIEFLQSEKKKALEMQTKENKKESK